MSRIYQIPSHARGWLALSVLTASLPQAWRGPLWQPLLLALVLVWRALVDRQRLPNPGRPARLLLLFAVLAATWHSYGRFYGPEAGTALVTALFALKYLEIVGKRDAYVLLMLGYFVCATVLLFQRGPGMALYVTGCLVLLTASLAGINYSDTHAHRRQHLAVAGAMVLQALPLAVILFVLVPRIAPLWNMHMGGGQARTGVGGSMAPGRISDLTRSHALAFRVQFQGAMPPHRDLYWRGLTYSHFDGTTWRPATPAGEADRRPIYRARRSPPAWYRTLLAARAAPGPVYRYRVIMAPSHRRWLYALAVPFPRFGDGIGLARDLRLVADHPIDEPMEYRVTSRPAARAAPTLDASQRRRMLQLPSSGDPRARNLAQQWRRKYHSDRAVVDAALRYFREKPFHYTLKPPPLSGNNTVDQFLFATRSGFCEHYASAFTFLMRAAGIPARVVAGYQGGKMNAGEYLQVRQYDAHAWSEVWLAGHGWVRVDPTAAVAPERIDQGLRAALEEQGDSADADGLGGSTLPGLYRLRQWMDYLDFNWQKWVLGYRGDQQLQLLKHLLGQVTPARIGLALLVATGVFVAVLAALVLLRRRPERRGPLQREFARLHDALARRGLTPSATVSAARLEGRIVAHWPAAAGAARDWRACFETLAYRQEGIPGRADLAALRRHRRRLLRRLGRAGGEPRQ